MLYSRILQRFLTQTTYISSFYHYKVLFFVVVGYLLASGVCLWCGRWTCSRSASCSTSWGCWGSPPASPTWWRTPPASCHPTSSQGQPPPCDNEKVYDLKEQPHEIVLLNQWWKKVLLFFLFQKTILLITSVLYSNCTVYDLKEQPYEIYTTI